MLEALIFHFTGGNKAQFAKHLGVSPQTISAWVARNTFDSELIYAKCRFINPSWLLTGEGNMLIKADNTQNVKKESEAMPFNPDESNECKPIPLVTERAAAGFGNEYFSIQKNDVKDYYIIPKFRFCNVDFMIEVSGLSMYPHFKSGDVIACTIIKDASFIQWNRCHVIATREQGILVKRIMPSEEKGCFKIVSDNKEYPPFDLPKEEITGIALVVGSVSLE